MAAAAVAMVSEGEVEELVEVHWTESHMACSRSLFRDGIGL